MLKRTNNALVKVVAAVIIATVCPTVSFAQGRRGGMRGGGRGGTAQMDERTVLILLSALLNLNDSQQQQLGTVFDAAVKSAAPIATQIETGKETLFEAVKSGKIDDQIKNLADQQAALTSRMLALQAQTFSKLWVLLNSDQKSQVDASMYGDIGEFLSNAKQVVPPTTVGESP